MERYLLFDGGCTLCTGLAQDIERETNGWLTARSLRDPAMKALLDQERPGWKWEPTLVEVSDKRVRVHTGIKMRSRLAIGLGPKRAVRVAQLVQQGLAPKVDVDQGRRALLKRGAMLAGFLIVGPRVALSPATSATQEQPPQITWLSDAEGAALVAEARKDRAVKELSKWLSHGKGWREKTAVPFTVNGPDIKLSLVALVDAATSGIIVYAQGGETVAIVPNADGPADAFGIIDGRVQQVPNDKLPSTKVNYELLHRVQPAKLNKEAQFAATDRVQALAVDCCSGCTVCLASNLLCYYGAYCCLVNPGCCGPAIGVCFGTFIYCSNQAGCNCFGAC